MKQKIICLFLCAVLLLSIFLVPCHAEAIDGEAVSFELEWTDMLFSFDEGKWNETNHVYDGRGWKPIDNCGKITVNNNGNFVLNVSFAYSATQGFENIDVRFLKGTQAFTTQNVEINEVLTVSVCPIGEPSEYFDTADMGTITVTVAKAEEVTE